MISNFFYSVVTQIVQLLYAVFPLSDGLPEEVFTAFTFVGGYFEMLDPLVPRETLVTTVGIAVTVELLIFAFIALNWVYKKLPFIGK